MNAVSALDLQWVDQQRLAALIGQDMAGVLELSLDARVLRVNEHLCRLTGFPREALLGRHLSECTPPEDWPANRAALDGLLAGELPAAIETRLNCRDGGLVWVSSISRLVRTDTGEPAVFIALLLDISPAMSLRDRLILSEERLRLALDGARMGVWYWSLGGERVECSHVALACFGLAPGARPAFGDILAQVHADDRERVESAFLGALQSLEPLDIEFRVRPQDGIERWITVIARASLDAAGQHGGMQGLVGDVTRRKAQERLLKRSLAENIAHIRQAEILNALLAQRAVEADTAARARDALLRNVSHEFRTPLNHVCGALDVLLAQETEPSRRRWIVTARESADALSRIIAGVMDVARLASGSVHSEPRDFAPATVLSEVASMLSGRVKARELTVLSEIAPDVPQWVSGDGANLAQALLNYFDNAIKFTPSGTITLAVRRVPSEQGAQAIRLRFEVRDTGIGIRKDLAERLFKPFVQGDDSITRPYGGLGIGLSNACELARLMGGTAGVESRPGEGSNFWLEVPVEPAKIDHLLVVPGDLASVQHAGALAMTPGEVARVMDYLLELRGLLRADDMRAAASLHGAPPALRVLVGEEDFEQLRREVETFDFPAAVRVLDRIEKRLAAE